MKLRRGRVLFIFCLLLLIIVGGAFFLQPNINIDAYETNGLNIQHQFLTINPNSRPGKELKRVKGIVIHYTANPGSSAQNNRDYFESLKDKKITSASSHFIVGLDGEIIQCVPLNEISYASNNRHKDTISIETCHPDNSGQFNKKTYQSLQKLVSSLKETYHLKRKDIIRHYDVTGKICPKYFVDHEDAWETFLDSI